MKCKIDITAETDLAAWVSQEAFMANIDPQDLACRESEVVFDWYHPQWFRRGINGRHRAVLLFRHLDVIPMLLVLPERWPVEKQEEQRVPGN